MPTTVAVTLYDGPEPARRGSARAEKRGVVWLCSPNYQNGDNESGRAPDEVLDDVGKTRRARCGSDRI